MPYVLQRAVAGLERLGGPAAWAFALAGVLLLGWLDFVTGFEVSFALFYLLPVAFAAWRLGRAAGWTVSLASAGAWMVSNRLAGELHSSALITLWNMGTRLGFFLSATELLVRLRRAFQELRELTRRDFLTGALNARGFFEAAEAECERLRRHRRPLTLAYLDLDGFKQVNDRHGHEVGDRVLLAVATTIREGTRRVDTLARLGGDEFALLLPETDGERARRFLDRLRGALRESMGRAGWPVTVSVGAITCEGEPPGVDELVRRADDLMYEVKAAGKDAIRFGTCGGAGGDGRLA